jgi:hypothetical protein
MQSIEIDEKGINEFFKNLKQEQGQIKINFEEFKKLVTM